MELHQVHLGLLAEVNERADEQGVDGDPQALYDLDFLSAVAVVLNLRLFFQAGRRFYGCTAAGSAWRAVLALAAMVAALNAYRFFLFVVTTWQVKGALS